MNTPLYKQAFPNFDYELPLHELTNFGFDDCSWHNDACPIFINSGTNSYAIFFNYQDPNLRELGSEDLPLITVSPMEDGTISDCVIYKCNSLGNLSSWLRANIS